MEPAPIDVRSRYLDGLAAEAVVDRAALDRPGVTVVGRGDRAGSNALACYWIDDHLVVWADPAVVERAVAAGLDRGPGAEPAPAPSGELVEELVGAVGFSKLATVVNNLLDGPPTRPGDLGQSGAEYRRRRLRDDEPGTVDLVRAFTEGCDPDDVDAADLDDLDHFAEAAINVVVPADDPDHLVAYASASVWDWDPTLADIGVLVHADHRRRGLANFVVANTVAGLLAEGRIPLYRHGVANFGSRAVAAAIGFSPVAVLDYYVLDSPPEPTRR